MLLKLKLAEESIMLLAKKLADSGHELGPELLSSLPPRTLSTISILSPANNINSSKQPDSIIKINTDITPGAKNCIQRKNSVDMFDHDPIKAAKIFGHSSEMVITPSILGHSENDYQNFDSAGSKDDSDAQQLFTHPAVVFDASIPNSSSEVLDAGNAKLKESEKINLKTELDIAARLSAIVAVSSGLSGWIKYNFNKPGSAFVKVWINLTPNTNELNFNWKAEGLFSNHKGNNVPGSSIKLVSLGRVSKVFRRNDLSDNNIRTQTRVEERSMSIVLKDRTIDLMAPNENDYKLLIDVLRWSLPNVEISG